MRKYVLGVVLGAILAVGPALAMKWSFSGSFRVDPTFSSTTVGTSAAVTNFAIVDPGNSRFRLKGTMDDGSYLYFEAGVPYKMWHENGWFSFDHDTSSGTFPTRVLKLRHAYALINTPMGKVKFGHTWSVLDFVFANQRLNHDLAAIGYGNLYGGRVWEVVFCKGPAKVAFVEPKAAVTDTSYHSTEVKLPKIEASFAFGPANVSFSYNSFKEEGADTATINTFALAAFAGLPLGPAKVLVNGWFGQNLYTFCCEGAYHAPYVDSTGTVKNTTGMGGFAQVMAKAGKGLFTAGLGMDIATEPEKDVWAAGDSTKTDKATKMVLFANYKLNLTKSFYIQPEFALFSSKVGDNDNAKVSQTLFGVHLQYDWK